jgi:hypothetical protein
MLKLFFECIFHCHFINIYGTEYNQVALKQITDSQGLVENEKILSFVYAQ